MFASPNNITRVVGSVTAVFGLVLGPQAEIDRAAAARRRAAERRAVAALHEKVRPADRVAGGAPQERPDGSSSPRSRPGSPRRPETGDTHAALVLMAPAAKDSKPFGHARCTGDAAGDPIFRQPSPKPVVTAVPADPHAPARRLHRPTHYAHAPPAA